MVVPYAYLGFKATNKSKRKFAMYDGFFNHFDIIYYVKNLDWMG